MDMLEGEVVAEHRATYSNRVALTLFLIVPGMALSALALSFEPKDADMRAPILGIAVALLALGVLAFVQQNRTRVVVRTDGLERYGLRGQLWALKYADMSELHYRVVKIRLYHVIPIATYTYIKVTGPDGKKRKVPTSLKGMDVLAERVVEAHATQHFAAARARIDGGEEVKFGKWVILDREKVQARKLFGGYKACPLGEVEKVSVDAGILRIRQKGKTFAFTSLQVGAVPNVFLLLRLLDSLLGQKPAATGQDRDFSGAASVG